MNCEAKTYSEYKKQFESEEDFWWELGQLSEVEARKLIENEDTSVTAKAGMFATWKKAHAELDGVMEFIKVRSKSEEEEKFMEDCEKHWEYPTIEIYIEAIKRWLTLSNWHYTPLQAEDRIKEGMHFIIESYERGDTVADIAVEVGYVCG